MDLVSYNDVSDTIWVEESLCWWLFSFRKTFIIYVGDFFVYKPSPTSVTNIDVADLLSRVSPHYHYSMTHFWQNQSIFLSFSGPSGLCIRLLKVTFVILKIAFILNRHLLNFRKFINFRHHKILMKFSVSKFWFLYKLYIDLIKYDNLILFN